MVILTRSLSHWLLKYYPKLLFSIAFGHIELFTEEMKQEYIAWCKTEEGAQYLEGGSKYKPPARMGG